MSTLFAIACTSICALNYYLLTYLLIVGKMHYGNVNQITWCVNRGGLAICEQCSVRAACMQRE